MKRTSRGFAIFTEFTDTKGAEVRVQASSYATGRRVWIFVNGGLTLSKRQRELADEAKARQYQMPGDEIVNDASPAHLTPAQARRVARALLRFADRGGR